MRRNATVRPAALSSPLSPLPERDNQTSIFYDRQMVLRWVATGMGEAAKQFRRANGHLQPPALRAALDRTVSAIAVTEEDAT